MIELAWTQDNIVTPRYGDPRTQAIIARCLDGDDRAYGMLYNMYAEIIYRLTFSILQHQEDAEEVLQDSFEYAFRKLHKFNPNKASFKTWIYQIALSRCRNKRRRKWLPSFSLNWLTDQELTDENAPAPDQLVALSERQQTIWQALAELSPKLRETAVLRHYEGLTYPEIGKILGIPAKTAESRVRSAHKVLRQLLDASEI